jgi:hypothetical protein
MNDPIDDAPNPNDRRKWKEEMDAFFDSTDVNLEDVSPKQLRRWLVYLASRHKEYQLGAQDIIRGITINHLRMERMMADFERSNSKTQLVVLILATVSVIVGVMQIVIGLLSLCK